MKKCLYVGIAIIGGCFLILCFLLITPESLMPKTILNLRTEFKLHPVPFLNSIHANCFPSQNLDEKRLQEKINKGLPNWAIQQIQEDLSRFDNFKASQLDAYFQKNGIANNIINVVRFQIKNKKVRIILPKSPKNWTANNKIHFLNLAQKQYQPILEILEFLAKKGYIQNADFILGINDFAIIQGDEPVPIFTFAKDLDNSPEKTLILMPDWMNYCSANRLRTEIRTGNQTYPWANKKAALFWRGGTQDSTGFRKKLVAYATQHPEQIDAKFLEGNTTKFVKPAEHLNYKYLISVDGARCSWERLVWHLHSNSLTFKHQSNQVQWYYKGIKPYVHYVPIQDEASILTAIDWAETHPTEVQKMIKNSTEFVEENLALEDMYHYLIVLLKEYSKRL